MLIRTKIKIPLSRSNLLYRKDLIQRLNASKGYPFVLVSGPAGSGKTSLACQWLENERLAVAWYSLDQEDNDPDSFYRYLLAALIKADSSLNAPLGPMLGNQQQLTADLAIPLVIESLTEAGRTVCLVLDDFHLIENQEILNALARLMQYMPSCLQIIVLSRCRLPAVMDIIALKNEYLEISAFDLKLTDTETADLIINILQAPISTDQIRELNQRVEGWAAGLQLIGLEAGAKGGGFDLSNLLNQAHEQFANYLIHDILSMQPEQIRNFVLVTALLDRFNPGVCAEVTGQKAAAGLLERIARLNLFLIPLDRTGQWYRYHHMFSEAIRRRLTIDDPSLVCRSLRQAAKWFAANSHIEDAMRSAFQCNDMTFAADLMEEHVFQYIKQLNPGAGLRWIMRLPSAVLNQRVLLMLYQCHFLTILMEHARVRDILATIEGSPGKLLKRYPPEKQTFCKDYTLFMQGCRRLFNAESSEDLAHIEMMARKISSSNSLLSRTLELYLVYGFLIKGDLPGAEAILARCSELSKSSNLLLAKIYFDKAKTHMTRLRGQLYHAGVIINRIHQEIDRQGMRNTPLAFVLYRHLGYIYYLQNRLPEAKKCLASAVRYCEHSDLIDQVTSGNELQLLLHLAAGEKEQAGEYFKQLRAYAAKFGLPAFTAGLDAYAARMAIDQHNLAPAVLWSQQRKLEPDEIFSQLFVMECQTQARLYYAQKAYRKALLLLERLRRRCVKRELLEFVLHIDILQSAILRALSCHEAAKSLLKDALAFSEKEGYVRPFVDDTEKIAPVLHEIAKDLADAPVSVHLETVFAACRIPLGPSIAPDQGETRLDKVLTRREIEILEWMARGAKNKEISLKASITVGTVKTHVHRILNKLEVQTRTQAVIKARALSVI